MAFEQREFLRCEAERPTRSLAISLEWRLCRARVCGGLSSMKLSIVSTLYRSEEFLDEFLERAMAAGEVFGGPFEMILVDDGSPDQSLARAIEHVKRDPRIVVVELARNFGHHAAILAGLEQARGAFVFFVDSDLEEPPELLNELKTHMDAEDADVVYGVHAQKTGGLARRVTSGGFWKLFNLLSDTKVEPNICHVRLMRRAYVDALLSLDERNLFLGGVYSWVGLKQASVEVDRQLRRKQSTYSPLARLSLFANSLTAFSSRPLLVVFFAGLSLAVAALIVSLYFIIRKIVAPETIVSGFAMLIVSIMFFSGVTIVSQGIIGLYVARIFTEVKRRPRHIVRKIWRDAAQSPETEALLSSEEAAG